MKNLYNLLYKTYIKELYKLNIGYIIDHENLEYMLDLMNAIDYIENGNPLVTEILKLVAYYE